MKAEEIKRLFPKTVYIPQYLIDMSNNGLQIGELALMTFVPKELWDEIFWGLSIGRVQGVAIKTDYWDEKEKMFLPLYLNEIKSPTEITFKLRKNANPIKKTDRI